MVKNITAPRFGMTSKNKIGHTPVAFGDFPSEEGTNYDESWSDVFNRMRIRHQKQVRFFWTILTIGFLLILGIIYEMNQQGAFDGWF